MDILDQILNAQKGSREEKVENFRSLFAEVKQDSDIEGKKGTQPAKYFKGMSKSTKDKRDAHFNKNKEGPAPGDSAETKPSKFNAKFKKMYGEELEENAGLEKKAEKSGMPLSILKKVYNRGLAAYKGGHRPGATAPQWAMARVNSFVTKSKGTWGKADADLAKQVRGESLEEDNVAVQKAMKKANQTDELERLKLKHERELENMKDRHERENERLDRAKEKETQDVAIQKKREADRKKNEEVEIEEGKLVADTMTIVNTVMKKIEKQVQKELQKNREKGLGMLNTLGSFVGHKVTDKKQEKGKLFLKFGDNLDESVDIKKQLKKVKGLTKKQMDFLLTLPTPVLTTMINQLSSLAMGEDLEEKGLWDNIRAKKARGEKMRKKGEKGAPTDDQVKRAQGEERDYKKEYANYHSSPEQIKRRAKRNEARRILKNRKGIKGKDVHHKDNNPMNNDKSNLSIVSQNFNRKEPRLREKGEK